MKSTNAFSGKLWAVSLVVGFLLFPVGAFAMDVAGIKVPETVTTASGQQLALNGAGIRTKFFFKIYVAELYLEHPSRDVKAVIGEEGVKRVVMHILYDEVSKEKLVDGWNEGFKKNVSSEELVALQPRIGQFDELFTTVKKGDEIIMEYRPDTGTEVTIRGEKKGVVQGKDFNDALLSIWLGDEPVTNDLKEALLDYSVKR